MSKAMHGGFTLAETLVTILIVLVLAGMLLATLSRAKRQGHVANDIEAMRQIGAAWQLYAEQQGGETYALQKLISTGLIPAQLVASVVDPTADGLANQVQSEASGRKLAFEMTDTSVPLYLSLISL
jgi:prepilin-type N-terminal cleavage/methylation domain-containing protein